LFWRTSDEVSRLKSQLIFSARDVVGRSDLEGVGWSALEGVGYYSKE
jgi:hypothetical protein